MGTHRTIRQPNGYCENLPHTTFCILLPTDTVPLKHDCIETKTQPIPVITGNEFSHRQKRNGPEMGAVLCGGKRLTG